MVGHSATAGLRANRIESLLSARLFLEPQLANDTLYFISNLSGHLSLYAMDAGGGVPEPLLPPTIALQNPDLVGGEPYYVLPELDRIVVMIDHDGDENYEPFVIPLEGGFPEQLSADAFHGRRSHLLGVDAAAGIGYIGAESREEPLTFAIRVELGSGDATPVWQSAYGALAIAWNADHSRVALADFYTMGDGVLYEPGGGGERRVILGTPIEDREQGVD